MFYDAFGVLFGFVGCDVVEVDVFSVSHPDAFAFFHGGDGAEELLLGFGGPGLVEGAVCFGPLDGDAGFGSCGAVCIFGVDPGDDVE